MQHGAKQSSTKHSPLARPPAARSIAAPSTRFACWSWSCGIAISNRCKGKETKSSQYPTKERVSQEKRLRCPPSSADRQPPAAKPNPTASLNILSSPAITSGGTYPAMPPSKHYKVDFAHLSLAYPTACTPPCSGPNHSFPHTYPPPPCTSHLACLSKETPPPRLQATACRCPPQAPAMSSTRDASVQGPPATSTPHQEHSQ